MSETPVEAVVAHEGVVQYPQATVIGYVINATDGAASWSPAIATETAVPKTIADNPSI